MNITQDQFSTLVDLGLTKNQVEVYLCLLKNGISSVLEISKITRYSRQNIYDAVDKLLNLGLVEIARKDRRRYLAVSPQKLLKLSHGKVQSAQYIYSKVGALVPQLEKLPKNRSSKQKTKIITFEGFDSIKKAYEKELESCKNTEVLSFVGSLDDIYDFLPEQYWSRWNKKFVAQKNTSKMIVSYSALAAQAVKNDFEYSRVTRYLSHFPFQTNIDIWDDKVLIVSLYDDVAIWIESPVLFQSYKSLFEHLWEKAKKFD